MDQCFGGQQSRTFYYLVRYSLNFFVDIYYVLFRAIDLTRTREANRCFHPHFFYLDSIKTVFSMSLIKFVCTLIKHHRFHRNLYITKTLNSYDCHYYFNKLRKNKKIHVIKQKKICI